MKLKFNEEIEIRNQEAFDRPQIGDYWHEMFSPYFIIVDIRGDKYTILNALGGPDSFLEKQKSYTVARVNVKDGWYWDYSKTMVVDIDWIRDKVIYRTIPGFVAYVINNKGTQEIVTEWRDWKQKDIRNRIKILENEWEEFTGWKYLKSAD